MIPTSKEEGEVSLSPKAHGKQHVIPLSPHPASPGALALDPATASSMHMVSPTRRKRRIRFDKVVHNRRIPHLNDLTQEQIEATWIQPEEYLEIKNRCVATVKKMMRNELTEEDIESEEHCTRGLEGKTRAGSTLRREHKLDSIAAVIEEQTLQWNEDVEDEEAIMEVYSVFSIPCCEAAYQLGLEDAEAAREYLQSSVEASSAAEANSRCRTENPSKTSLISSAGDRLRDILFLRSSHASLLCEIERNFYDEAAMERRTARQQASHERNSLVLSQLREFFSQRSNKDGEDLPSLDSIHSHSTGDGAADDREHSDHSASSFPKGCENFTTQLNDIFSTRKRRQALLDDIERGYHVEAAVTGTNNGTSQVMLLTQTIGSRLKDIFYSKKTRAAVLNELSTSTHLRH